MPLPTLPPQNSQSWYSHYSALHRALTDVPVIVAASDSPQGWKDRARYICDGVDDQTDINNAISDVDGLQGIVLLAPTVTGYQTRAPITIVGRVQLIGGGGWGRTRIRGVSGHSAVGNDNSGIVMFADPVGIPYDMGALKDVYIDGSGQDLNGFASVLTQTTAAKDDNNIAGSPDTQFALDYVMVASCGRRGIYVTFAGGSASTSWHVDHCFVFGCGDSGAYAGIDIGGTDCWISNCNVGSQGSEGAGIAVGFRCAGSDNNWVDNTAWVTKGDGFLVTGAKQALTNCQSHHSTQDGFSIQNNRNVLTGCISYNNARDGFRVNANNNSIVGFLSFDDGDSFAVTGRPQDTGVNLVQGTARGHCIIGTTFGSGLVPVAGTGMTSTDNNFIDVVHTGNDVNGSTGTRSHTRIVDGRSVGRVWTGSGTPEGTVSAPVGTIWLRSDGGAGTTLYVKESGTGLTGWSAV